MDKNMTVYARTGVSGEPNNQRPLCASQIDPYDYEAVVQSELKMHQAGITPFQHVGKPCKLQQYKIRSSSCILVHKLVNRTTIAFVRRTDGYQSFVNLRVITVHSVNFVQWK